jgi:uncharacterized membrane protein (UPF0127 family)
MTPRTLRPRRGPRTLGAIALCAASVACSNDPGVPEGRELVTIKGERFYLEPAIDDATRFKGLGGRETIEPNGGMIFVFPQPRQLAFVMRDCLAPVDIAFLSETGRVMTFHEMTPEEPQKPGESDLAYENRLPRYPSRFRCRYAVEVAGGTWDRLGLAEGDVIEFDIDGLKARAR